jgi:uncharacterized protein YndB with AHSA1/START domain/DNA-binding transcriptional ArsR family regulator
LINQEVDNVGTGDQLSSVFAALADPVRRAILTRLAAGEATVNELAEPFPISLQAISKHLTVLERAGLITRSRDGQSRPSRFRAAPLEASAAWIDLHRQLDRLDQHLHAIQTTTERDGIMSDNYKTQFVAEPGRQDIVITRLFDAPRELVFRAMTEPEHVQNWWGPSRYATIVDSIDPKTGGHWRFINRDSEGNEYGFHGVYHEITAPERIVQTFEFEGMPGHVLLETMTLEDVDGKTRITGVSVFQSVEDRDGMLASGMEEGAAESWDRLAEVLAGLSR